MAVKKKSEAEETTATKVCNYCEAAVYAYQEIKTKRGTNVIICNNCWRGACKHG